MPLRTNNINISDLMSWIHGGRLQLPEFQRGWVWGDTRIKRLIASIISGYPVGATMFMSYGGDVKFKYRPIEGAPSTDNVPEQLILDGQQRLTSIYSALYSTDAANTTTDKGEAVRRFYYVSIEKFLDASYDMADDVIISVPESRKITSNFGKDIELDLSTPEKEYENKMFPLNIILDNVKTQEWQIAYFSAHKMDTFIVTEFSNFLLEMTRTFNQYQIPVICLDKDTPREAVCQVFENVNTGGEPLTVFELVTAIFAADDFELRNDWKNRQEQLAKNNTMTQDLLSDISATDFLTACTLIAAQKNGRTVSCKKKDVLALKLDDYKAYADILTHGFIDAAKILIEERIFIKKDLPYTTQLIPFAVLCALLSEQGQLHIDSTKTKLRQWFWCGVFGEMYGSANETRFANDVVDVMRWMADNDATPRSIQESYFNPMRLLSLRTRQSAAYKGILALILKNHSKDFISGRDMDFATYIDDHIDIHHIFPQNYCESRNLPEKKWNCAVNKTPISAATNRSIGGRSPQDYLATIVKTHKVDESKLDSHLESHWISPSHCHANDFNGFFIDRAKKLLDAIGAATGKPISGRDNEEVIEAFGGKLI